MGLSSQKQTNTLAFIAKGLAVLAALLAPSVTFAADLSSIANALYPTLPADPSLEVWTSLLFGFFIGVLLTAACYLFFIWVVIRDKSQIFLIMLLLCLAMNMAATNDVLMTELGVSSDVLRHLLQSYSMTLAYIVGIFFTTHFLSVEQYATAFKIPLNLAAFVLFCFLAYSTVDPKIVHFILPTLGTLTISLLLATGAASFRRDVDGSLIHILAFTLFLFGGLAESMHDIGLIVSPVATSQISYTAYSLAALVFAIVIAGQFAARQDEKERALAISNERFSLAVRGTNEGLFDWNLRTGDVYFSDLFRKIIGNDLENSAKGLKTWVRRIRPSDRRVIRRALRKFQGTNQPGALNLEYRITTPDGQNRWIHTKAVATRNPNTNTLSRLVGSTSDITERKRSEVALRISEQRFRSITEAHPVPVLIASLATRQVLYASPGAETLLGLPHGTLTSHTLDRFLVKPEERHDILAAMTTESEVNLKEVTIIKGDGDPLIAALSARRINYQNEPAMVVGLYDLTEAKDAEEKIAKQQEALQQSEKMAALGGLLAGVAHELNNPLSVVIGQATLMMESSPDPKIKARAEKIFKSADRCSRIVKSFLAIARRKPAEKKPVNLSNALNASLDLVGHQFRNENIHLTIEFTDTLPEITGDQDQLTQVFTNLELNAAQAMTGWDGPREFTIRAEPHGMGEVLISFIDTGPGIPKEIRSRVFEPFFTTKSTKGGTGVGLSLCLNIIETHGGHILIEDTNGGGATFLITMPTIRKTQGPEPAHEAEQSIHKPKGQRILIVDDEVELAQTLADLLEPDGHETVLAADGSIALEKLRESHFDIIISDLRMPVLDGPGMYAEIERSFPEYLSKIVFVTGDTLSTHIHTFLSNKTVPVIEKPYRMTDVKAALARLLVETDENGAIKEPDSVS